VHDRHEIQEHQVAYQGGTVTLSQNISRWTGRLRAAPSWLLSSLAARIWLRSCDRIGLGARTFKRPNIENRGRMLLGRRLRLNSGWAPVELATGPDGTVEIGDGVFINYGSIVCARQQVKIGSNVMIGNYCIIADTEIPDIEGPGGGPSIDARPVEIGDGAWLAARVTVLPGARIGAGATIAAGSIVAGEIPPGCVAGGIPARVLRKP
jgi:acetyltransferase-like isoleucine patch superfamily enzyme